MQKRKEFTLKTDILIIGNGSSGMWAEKRAKELAPELEVTIVDKGPTDWGGLMSMSEGDFDAVTPGKSLDEWMQDLVYYWDGLCDQKTMKTLFGLSYDRMCDYQNMGVSYLKDKNGNLRGVAQRGLEHICLYPTDMKGDGGESMAKALTKALEKAGIKRFGRIMIVQLMKNKNGQIEGAAGFDTISGDFYKIETKVVLIAAGRGGWKASYGNNTASGEWVDMALKAGAKVRNFEFVEVWNVPKLYAWEGQTILLPLGARYVNAAGEPFMSKYSPKYGANTDPHYITMAMAYETREGRGPIYFDLSQMTEESIKMVEPNAGWQLLNHQKLSDMGMNFFTSKTEWMPQLLTDFGGLDTDLYGQTTVSGLFAAGRSRSLDNGVYMGGFDLSTTSTTGYLAGEGMVRYIREKYQPTAAIAEERWNTAAQEIYQPLQQNGIHPKEVLRKIQELVFPYQVCILKTEESLQDALEKLTRLQQELLSRMTASDPHYLMKLYEVRGIFRVTELYLRASLLRRESRAGHFREDYPQRDDEQYLGWILLSEKDDHMEHEFRRVPIEEYEYEIKEYYSDQFCFPVLEQTVD